MFVGRHSPKRDGFRDREVESDIQLPSTKLTEASVPFTAHICQTSGIYRVVHHLLHPHGITMKKGDPSHHAAYAKRWWNINWWKPLKTKIVQTITIRIRKAWAEGGCSVNWSLPLIATSGTDKLQKR